MSAPTTTNGRARAPRVPLDLGQVTEPEPEAQPAAVRAPTPNLDAAILRVSAKAAKLIRNAQGQVQNRRYEYVTLTAVMDEILPLLVEEDLLWKVKPTSVDHKPAVRYSMTHIPSDETDGDVIELECDRTMQAVGSGITYARRYCLVAYLNLTVDEDDDGFGANTPPRDTYAEAAAAHEQIAARAPQTGAPQTTARPPQRSRKPISPAQKKKINELLSEAKLSEGEAAAVKQWALGKDGPIDKAPSVGDGSASKLIERLLDKDQGGQFVLKEILTAAAAHDERARQITQRHLVAKS